MLNWIISIRLQYFKPFNYNYDSCFRRISISSLFHNHNLSLSLSLSLSLFLSLSLIFVAIRLFYRLCARVYSVEGCRLWSEQWWPCWGENPVYWSSFLWSPRIMESRWRKFSTNAKCRLTRFVRDIQKSSLLFFLDIFCYFDTWTLCQEADIWYLFGNV